MAFIDDAGTSYAYARLDENLKPGVYQSGFLSSFGGTIEIERAACHRRMNVCDLFALTLFS